MIFRVVLTYLPNSTFVRVVCATDEENSKNEERTRLAFAPADFPQMGYSTSKMGRSDGYAPLCLVSPTSINPNTSGVVSLKAIVRWKVGRKTDKRDMRSAYLPVRPQKRSPSHKMCLLDSPEPDRCREKGTQKPLSKLRRDNISLSWSQATVFYRTSVDIFFTRDDWPPDSTLIAGGRCSHLTVCWLRARYTIVSVSRQHALRLSFIRATQPRERFHKT